MDRVSAHMCEPRGRGRIPARGAGPRGLDTTRIQRSCGTHLHICCLGWTCVFGFSVRLLICIPVYQ